MLTIENVATTLGITERGVRLRVDLLSDILDAHLRRGPKNQLLFDDSALAILKRLEEVRRVDGLSLRQAAMVVRGEVQGQETKGRSLVAPMTTANKVKHENGIDEADWPVKKLIEELERERDYWREMALRLQEQVKELERLALPAPREARPWWGRRLFRWLWG
ncbi:MAG: hypothetical protein NZ651_05245 [Candidatus Bipolaricaulota bacterium]|nr:hypothetical protein [Candidatus Bipolaricaulota bacterium]MDW8127158.1 hypothetical protein [Candidatus Bipolaricaulota bacterium]